MSDVNTVFGIDLGTTYSCIAYVDDYGRPVVVPNLDGQLVTASVVELGDPLIVGEEAKKNAVLSPGSVVSMVKRHMGEQGWIFSSGGKDYTPEEISAMVLRKVVNDAQATVGHDIKRVVITCPAYFGINEREATSNAGKIAGLEVLAIINEPTAAAICYSMERADQAMSDQVAMVYDLGGGTFDVTVIKIEQGAITVIATGGDHHLGGRDWDDVVVQYLAQQWQQETGMYDNPVADPPTLQDLWVRAEEAKRALSTRPETTVRVTYQGQVAAITLTRAKFDELTANLLQRSIELTELTLNDAKLKGYTRFDQLLLVGGSTKMPQVKERLQREYNMEPRSYDPDQAVAKGAALYGLKLAVGQKIEALEAQGVAPAQAQDRVAAETGVRRDVVEKLERTAIHNVISHSFGVVALNDFGVQAISNLVIRQTQVPASATQSFGTVQANQATARIQIMENDENDAEVRDLSRGREIGAADLGLPPGLPAGSEVQVNFEITEQGRLDMTATEMTTRRMVTASIETKAVMSDEQVEKAAADLALRRMQ